MSSRTQVLPSAVQLRALRFMIETRAKMEVFAWGGLIWAGLGGIMRIDGSTFLSMLDAGWIELDAPGTGSCGYRLTDAGRKAAE